MKKKSKHIFQAAFFMVTLLSACTNDERALLDDVVSLEAKQEKTFHSGVLHSEDARTAYEKLLGYFNEYQTKQQNIRMLTSLSTLGAIAQTPKLYPFAIQQNLVYI